METTKKIIICEFLSGGGEMGKHIRNFDWTETPLGRPEEWSQSLQSTITIMLANRFPMVLWWGDELIQFYNNPYIPILGLKHPKSLGQPASECWAEIWHIVGPLIEAPFNQGPATWMDDFLLEINHKNFIEETHFTVAYSPVPDNTAPNGIGGVLGTMNEIGPQIIGERRIILLRDLAARSHEAITAQEACSIAAETLSNYPKDIPFALFYLFTTGSKEAHLVATAGVDMSEDISPMMIDISSSVDATSNWNLFEPLQSENLHVVNDLNNRFKKVPQGPWSDAPHSAAIIPVRSNKAHDFVGFLICGISSRLRFDEQYQSFFELLSSQISSAIATADTMEEEHKRAEALAEIDKARVPSQIKIAQMRNEAETHLKVHAKELEEKVQQRTLELSEANELLQQKKQEIALSKYNKRFLAEFSEKFSSYQLHNEFFNSLVQFIADTTHLDYVFVGKLKQTGPNECVIQTVALTAFGKSAENIHYPLPDGPCEQVIRGTVYSYPQFCRQIFSKNKIIAQFNVEGYIGYPLFDKQENAVGLIAVMHQKEIEDTETVSSVLKIVAKRAEMELEQIKFEEQLEQKNASLLLKNQELIKMNKELESFAYISSHDLQEPLRKIQTISSRILEKEHAVLSDNGKGYFHIMQDSARRMQTLIQDLIAYSRVNIAEHKFEQTDLNKIIEEVKDDLKETLEAKKATLETNGLGEAQINISQFRQMMYNLIGNSIKFSSTERPPHIIIKSEITKGSKLQNEESALSTTQAGLPAGKLSFEKNYCHITVSDNGIGFEPQYKDKIFEVFQRLHGKDEFPGTGIGLSIVKKIVENHNGIITAAGELNKGTTFNIYIPAS